MNKFKLFLTGILLLLFTACGNSNDFTIEVKEEIYFKEGKPSPVTIVVTDQNGPVENLQIKGVFRMANMDHGTIEAEFASSGDGIYKAEVDFAMPGKWEMVFTVNNNDETFEKVLEYEVKKSEGVATVNGEWITDEDIEFYRFINKLHIAINRENDKEKYEGQELESAMTYWDNQEKINDNQNTLLTQIIRLRAMALLGMEKGYQATEKEIASAVEDVRKQYGEYKIAQVMIKEYGEEKFWNKEQQQYKLIILTQKVQEDIINEVKEENPDVNEQEIMYLAQKEYEELLISQVDALTIKLM